MIFENIIYEEEFDSYETEVALERTLNHANMTLDMMYFESYENDSEKESKFKAWVKRAIEAFKAFINKCKEYLKSAINKITGRVSDAYVANQITNDIVGAFEKNISIAEKNGLTSFEFIDVVELMRCLRSETDEYNKTIKQFCKAYVKHGSPKDAEKMLDKFDKIGDKYNDRMSNIMDTKKKYSIRESKKVLHLLQEVRFGRKNSGIISIIENHNRTCDEVYDLYIKTVNSLNHYSEDTGYIQNAKTLQEMIHNSCIRVHQHGAEAITNIIKYGVPLICKINKFANTKKEEENLEDGTVGYKTVDTSSETHKKVREVISLAAKRGTKIANAELKSIRAVSRKNELKDWKFTNGESPLTFDRRTPNADELKHATMKAAPRIALQTAAAAMGIKNIIN